MTDRERTSANFAIEKPRMPLIPALEVIRDWRSDQIVVTTMATVREWPKLSDHPLDFHYMPSAMGQSTTIGLGLALAQPKREVVTFTGDGSLIMNLGALVTVVASRVRNYTLIVLDNGVYEVTGGQKTAAGVARSDFAGLATAAGFASVATFDDLADWRRDAATVLALPGPRFISLIVEPVRDDYFLYIPGPVRERVARLREALAR